MSLFRVKGKYIGMEPTFNIHIQLPLVAIDLGIPV